MSYKRILLILCIYLAIVFVCFGDALDYYFTKDDFLHLDIEGANRFTNRIIPHLMVYRPLTQCAYYVAGRFFFGLDPLPWHVSNLIFHALAALIVCLFSYRITREPLLGFLSGLLYLTSFANFHLIYWVTCIDQTLSLLSALAFWLLYLDATERDKRWASALCTGALAIALLANEANMAIPVMATAFWWIFLRNSERSKNILKTNLWLWLTLGIYALWRVFGYWHGKGQRITHIYDMKVTPAIPRNIVEMLLLMPNSLYLFSSALVEKGVLKHLYDPLWNRITGLLAVAAVMVCLAKREPVTRYIRNHSYAFKLAGFCLLWIITFLLPSSYIPVVWPWRITNALVGYNLLLAYFLTRISRRRAYYAIVVVVIVVWGWWGMTRIRNYGDPFVRITKFQEMCRNIAEDTESYLKLYPETGEVSTPSLYTNDEFFVATFAGQQFRLLLPKRVSYLLSPYDHDKDKTMLVLVYSEADSRMYLQRVIRPQKR